MLPRHQDRLKELCEQLTRYVAWCIGNADDAEDVVQDAWVAISQKIATGGKDLVDGMTDIQFRAYLRGIVWNKILHYRRKKARHSQRFAPGDFDVALAESSETVAAFEDAEQLLNGFDRKPAPMNHRGAASIAAQAFVNIERAADSNIRIADEVDYLAFQIAVANSLHSGEAFAELAECGIAEFTRIWPCRARWVHFLGTARLAGGIEEQAAVYVGAPAGADRAIPDSIIAAHAAEARTLGAERSVVLASEFETRPDFGPRVQLVTIDPAKYMAKPEFKGLLKSLGEALSRHGRNLRNYEDGLRDR